MSYYKKAFAVFVFFVLLILITTGNLSGKTTMSLESKLEQDIDSLMKQYSIPGAAIAVASKDTLPWIRCFGYADKETKESVSERTLFRMASVSKSFVALGFMKLLEQGEVDLNTALRKVIPEIEINNPFGDTDPVRIVHLLEHTSGFDAAHFYEYYNFDDTQPATPYWGMGNTN